jgi:hypothetical protein
MCKLVKYIQSNPTCDETCIQAGFERHIIPWDALRSAACIRQQQHEIIAIHRQYCWWHFDKLLLEPRKLAFENHLKTYEVPLPEGGGTAPALGRLNFHVRVCVLDFAPILVIHFMRRHWRAVEEHVHTCAKDAGGAKPVTFAWGRMQEDWLAEFEGVLDRAKAVYCQVRVDVPWEGQTPEFIAWFRNHPYYP